MARLCIVAVENGVFENYGLPFDMTAEAEDMGQRLILVQTYMNPMFQIMP